MDDATAPARGALDRRVLVRLAADLRSPVAATRFCTRFLALLPARLDRLGAALAAGDRAGALDATLSIAVSSAMLGGTGLTGLARDVERGLRDGDVAAAVRLLPRVRAEALALAATLTAALPVRPEDLPACTDLDLP